MKTYSIPKGDAPNFFDMLRAPDELIPWFARPFVRVKELAECMSCSVVDVARYVRDLNGRTLTEEDRLFPVSLVWPQGFSWSPFVAQEVSLAQCFLTVVEECQVLGVDETPPALQEELVTVSTDDIVFMHRSAEFATRRLQRLDATMSHNCIPQNLSKSIELASSMTALGCDLGNSPPRVEPAASKLLQISCA